MPFRVSEKNSYKTDISWNGKTLRAGCGTMDLKEACAIEEMIRVLKRNRQDDILIAIMNRDLKLGRAYTLYTQGKLTTAALAIETSVDVVPLIDEWLTGIRHMNGGTVPRTPADSARHLREILGDSFRASDFNSKNLGNRLRKLTLTGSTRNRYHTSLSVFAKFLVEQQAIERNPLRDVSRFKENGGREVWFDTHDDAKALVMSLPNPFRAVVALALSCGTEKQAIWRLRRRGFTTGAKPTVHAHGGKKPWRNRVIIPTDRWMWGIFEEYARDFLPNVLIFGNVVYEHTLDSIKEAMKESGLGELDHAPGTLHDMRHIYAVLALKDGMPLHLVARQLGHRDTTLAQKLYGRFVPEMADYDTYLSRSTLANPQPEKKGIVAV